MDLLRSCSCRRPHWVAVSWLFLLKRRSSSDYELWRHILQKTRGYSRSQSGTSSFLLPDESAGFESQSGNSSLDAFWAAPFLRIQAGLRSNENDLSGSAV